MNRIRAAAKARWVRVTAGASALAVAIIVSDTAMAIAGGIPNTTGSDRRLKRAIRSI
ncbi:hypothetical protein [Pseudonocardia sp. TRM90224]|uniref:hypothetical protein n=1 Tax=Pseudonocardia sp. TRM90224 TaxID=2812678 RepID=UPI001E2CB789|nr:hypothetical protein [Pseudonocardia sp. TRM90224]